MEWNIDSSWKGPTRLKVDLSLNDLCSNGPPEGMDSGLEP